jgi:hypothetical protein
MRNAKRERNGSGRRRENVEHYNSAVQYISLFTS